MTRDQRPATDDNRRSYEVPLPSGVLHLGVRCLVMGIVNVTPDSFANRGSRVVSAAAADAAFRMEAEGADLIDVGGESTRPGAEPVDADEERGRVLPVLERLAGRLKVPISIDTYKASVARQAISAGAAIINDISGLRFDPELARVAADSGAALVLMHSRGRPKTMNEDAVYGDVAADVIRELRDRIASATAAGVPRRHVIIDPGIGFAKWPAHSYGVLARLPEISAALDRPVLVGPSRKSFMREAVSGREASNRDWGTAAAVAAAVLNGAHIVRVHAVAEMTQVVRVAEEIRRHG
jgi:dihydropteroate synthase